MALYTDSEKLYGEFVKHDTMSLFENASDELRDNKDLMIRMLDYPYRKSRLTALMLKDLSDRLKDDDEVVLKCVHQAGESLRYASDRLKDDYNIALEACKSEGEALAFCSEELLDNKQFVIDVYNACPKKGNLRFSAVSYRLRDDYEIAKLYCQHGIHFQYLSERLKDDNEIARLAVKDASYAYQYASERLKDDENFTVFACYECGSSFRYASERLRSDKAVVRKIAGKSAFNYRDADESVRDDEELAYELCFADYEYMEYVSDRLKNNKEFIFNVIKKYPNAYDYVKKLYFDDDEIVEYMTLMAEQDKLSHSYLYSFATRFRDNPEFVKRWIFKFPYAVQDVSERLKEDYELCQYAYKCGAKLRNLGDTGADDYDIVYNEVLKDRFNIRLASERLRNDRLIVFTALNGHLPHNVYLDCDDIGGNLIQNVYRYIGDELKRDPQFLEIVITKFGQTYYSQKYNFDEIRNNPESIWDIIKKEAEAFEIGESDPEPQGLDYSDVINRIKSELNQ